MCTRLMQSHFSELGPVFTSSNDVNGFHEKFSPLVTMVFTTRERGYKQQPRFTGENPMKTWEWQASASLTQCVFFFLGI